MPCRDPGSDDWVLYGGRDRKLDELTRMLCDLCKRLEKNTDYRSIEQVKGLSEWWKDHQAADRRRLAEEAEEKRRERQRDEKELRRLQKKLGISS